MAEGSSTAARGEETPAPIWKSARYPLAVRTVNGIGRLRQRFGRRWPRLDADEMLASARRRAGLSEFRDDLFLEGFRVLVAAFDTNPRNHAFGRHVFRQLCLSLLINRLKIDEELKRHPEILDVPLARPLIITGLPRSGTTFLHRLMSEDPAGRTLLYWETMAPAPSPRVENYTTDPRIRLAQRSVNLVNRLAPQIQAAHHFAATEPEECNNLFAHEFRAGFLGFMFDVPDYVRWLNDQDRTPGYRSMKRQLQILSRFVRRDYWVLKAPAHLFGLEALLTVFPDACIVQTHRDPRKVIPSVAMLAAGFRSLTADPIDFRQLGIEFVEAMAIGPELAIQARTKADPSRFFDVRYETLVAHPVETVRAVCAHFGYDFTPEYEQRTRAHLAANPQHKHGVHRYSLDDFGLDAATVDTAFAGYNAWVEENLGQPA
ncbi:MAG: sulfotransferase [Isosphaeraceae bacterium]